MNSRRTIMRGFTLLEMTVTLLLVALMSNIIIHGLRFGIRAYAQVVKGNDANWELFVAQRFLRGALENVYPFDPRRVADKAYGLEGATTRLAFSASLARSSAPGALNRYELFVADDDHDTQRRHLSLSWRTDRNGLARAPRATESREVLVKNIESIELSDAKAPCGAVDIRWLGTWQGHHEPPALVRIRVIFPAGDIRQWPELIVAPRVTANTTSWLEQTNPVGVSCGSSG